MDEVEHLSKAKKSESDSVAYVLCALTIVAAVIHIVLLRNWPGWRYQPHPNPIAYLVQFLPVFALLVCIAAMVINQRGNGRLALRISYWLFIPTLCVLALDGCTGTIGMVD
ncbi:MAG TPA: hypothetical protein VHE09_09010 [Rhizomicrobium sp.]|nr:hypothetical protein [Rhizomicrobium sp.]